MNPRQQLRERVTSPGGTTEQALGLHGGRLRIPGRRAVAAARRGRGTVEAVWSRSMTEAYFTNPLIFLVKTLFGLYISIVVIRFLLQWARADFYNPISQFVVKVTSPVLRPLRKLIPGYGGIDLSASVLLAWLLKAAELAILTLLIGLGRNPLLALAWAVPALVGSGDQHLPVRDPDPRDPELGQPRPLQPGGERC
jgi:uncharacterized protein YggT (Ycf19 family)